MATRSPGGPICRSCHSRRQGTFGKRPCLVPTFRLRMSCWIQAGGIRRKNSHRETSTPATDLALTRKNNQAVPSHCSSLALPAELDPFSESTFLHPGEHFA